MPTDEMIASRRNALEREKVGYQIKLAGAETDEDKAKWKDRVKAVDASLSNLGKRSFSKMNKAELLDAAAAEGLDVDESNTKAEILEALAGE